MTAPEFDFKSYYHQFAKNITAQAIDRFTGGPRIDAVICQIIEDHKINARAKKLATTPYEYQVEIFDGLLTSLNLIFGRCINDPNFPYLKLPPRNGIVDQNAKITLHRMLMEHAFAFVTMHELAHIINGHLRLLASLGASEMMEETGRDSRIVRPLSLFDWQTLEGHADGTVVVFLSNRVLQVATNPDEFTQERSNSCYLNSDVAIEIMLFSIFCFFGATGYQTRNLAEAAQHKTHPPPAIRQISIVHALEQYINTRYPGYLRKSVAQLAIRAQELWSRFVAGAPDREILSAQLNDPGALAYAVKLESELGGKAVADARTDKARRRS